jgi:hypothetical protein
MWTSDSRCGIGRYCVATAVAWFASSAGASWDLNVTTIGANPLQLERIAAAEALWEGVIAGYQPGIALTGVTLTVTFADLPGGTLGQAGPTSFTNQGGFRLSTAGAMTLDTGLSLDTIEDVAAHEIGHILGIGTLWTDNGVYINGSGQYTGAFGLAAYRREFDPLANFVPVELDGGGGTANAHWDEAGFFSNELMSGFLSGSNFLSNTTIDHLRDLGFDTIGGIADLTGVDGDVNQDGVLSVLDITAFVAGWESITIGLNAVERTRLGDLNLSGITDLEDAFLLHQALPAPFRATLLSEISGGSIAVPEPSAHITAIILVTGVIAFGWSRRLVPCSPLHP